MDIISCGVQKVRPQVKSPQIIVECKCGCVYNININTESNKKFWDKGRKLFIWQIECPICKKVANIGVWCDTAEKALAYFFLRKNKWFDKAAQK